MASIDHRNIDQVDFLSDDFRGAIRRRFAEIVGLGLLVLAVMCALALATWSVQDPSFSHATNAPIRNLLGQPGRDRVRSADPDFRPRFDRDRDSGRGLGLAADHASRARSRMAASHHVDRGDRAGLRLRLLPAEKRRLAAAERAWRR